MWIDYTPSGPLTEHRKGPPDDDNALAQTRAMGSEGLASLHGVPYIPRDTDHSAVVGAPCSLASSRECPWRRQHISDEACALALIREKHSKFCSLVLGWQLIEIPAFPEVRMMCSQLLFPGSVFSTTAEEHLNRFEIRGTQSQRQYGL